MSAVAIENGGIRTLFPPSLPPFWTNSLRRVVLSGCSGWVTDAVVCALARRATLLEELDLSSCSRVSDVALAALAEHCPEMHTLSLWMCFRVSASAVEALCEACDKVCHQPTSSSPTPPPPPRCAAPL